MAAASESPREGGALAITKKHAQRGDTTVVHTGPPLHPGGGRLVEELAIGTRDGSEFYTFGAVGALAVGADESILIADPVGRTLRQYDRNGRYLRSIGRPGPGPGEFGGPASAAQAAAEWPAGVGILTDGRIVAQLGAGRRLNFYDPAGNPLATTTRQYLYNRNLRSNPPLLLVARGDVIYVHHLFPAPGFVRRGLRRTPPGDYARLTSDGTPIDTLVDPYDPRGPPALYVGRAESPQMIQQVPFTPDFLWTLSPLGYFVTGMPVDRGGSYSLELRIPEPPAPATAPAKLPRWRLGNTVTSIRVPHTPVPVIPAERRDWIGSFTAGFRQYESAWRWNGPEIPANKPPYKRLWVDSDGRIWVQRHAAAVEDRRPQEFPNFMWSVRGRWPEPNVYDIVEPSGRYLGRITSTDEIIPQVARGDRLWAIVVTADGPLTVKRYRVVWAH